MKLKCSVANEILANLNNCNFEGTKFNYAISKNKIELRRVLEAYYETAKGIGEKYGEKDEKGNLIIIDGKRLQITDVKKYDKEMEVIGNEEVEIEFYKLDFSELPKNIGNQMDGIIYFLNEELPEAKVAKKK